MATKQEREQRAVFAAVGIGAAVLVVLGVSLHAGTALAGLDQDVPINPLAMLIKLLKGTITWPIQATLVAVLLVPLIVGLVMLWRRLRGGGGGGGSLAVDDKAQFMAKGSALEPLTADGVRRKAIELGVDLGRNDAPGVLIGRSVSDDELLYGSYEDLQLDIWGPRQGKTSSRVIPAIVEAIGPVVVTSNKRDVVDATREARRGRGSEVWVFDPQGVAREEPTWFWDPLDWVRGTREDNNSLPEPGDALRAEQLAGHFADADDIMEGTKDTFFESEAEDLLAAMFLAGALARVPITEVWRWITNDADPARPPVAILRRHGRDATADGLSMQYGAHPQQRGGVFGTAKKMARCLKMDNIEPWVNRGGGRQAFDEEEFLQRGGSLYCLSLEGRGSASPLVSALTWAVVEVAMRKAADEPGGRLSAPLLAVLDEAANVVRWRDLPKQYSHFGSRGIVVMTVLQSWAQGENCWGQGGMAALWSAATIRVLGGGVDDVAFLRDRSEIIGTHEVTAESVTSSKGGKSYSESAAASTTMSVADLQALPRGRAVLFAAGMAPTLIRTESWWDGPHAKEVKASIEAHNPVRQYRKVEEFGEPDAYAKLDRVTTTADLAPSDAPQEVKGL